MKKSFFKSLLPILGGAFLCIVLAGCENFLKGADVKQQLDNAVEYANARACKLYLKSESDQGSFLTQGQVECRVGFAVDLQFTLNKEYWYFESLQAVAASDEKQSRADCVEFTLNEKKSDLERGVYVISTKLLKAADDILIQPKCLEIPYIKQYSPSETRVQYANTPIVITFNMPVEDEAVTQAESVFNYDNIKLSAANIDYSYYNDSFDGDMRDYFYPPEFNSQKTLLTLTPKGELLKQFVANLQSELKLSFLEINVSFTNITVEQEELTFSLKEGTVSDFVIRYNSETETDPPEKVDLFITKEEITLSSVANAKEEYKYAEKETGYSSGNHTKDLLAPSTLYIYGKFYDQDSGVAVIEVTENFENPAPSLSMPSSQSITTSYSIKEKNDSISFSEDGTGYTSFVLKYTLQETLKSDPLAGLLSLKVLVKDLCGNSWTSTKVGVLCREYADLYYYTAWDKANNKYPAREDSVYLKPTPFDVCNAPYSKVSGASGTYDFAKYNSDIKTIRIKDEDKPSVFLLYDHIKPSDVTNTADNIIYSNEVDYICEYIDRNGNKRREPFTPYNPNSETKERTLTLDLDSVAGKSFDIIPMYNGSPIGRQKFTFPDKPLLSSISNLSFGIEASEDESSSNTNTRLALCKYPDNSYKIVFLSSGSTIKSKIPDDCSCYFVYARLRGTSQAFSQNKYTFNGNKYVQDSSYTAAVGTELNSNFQPTKMWFDRGLLSELLGPYSKDESEKTRPGTPSTSFAMSRGNEGYINVTLQWASDLWEKYDSLICKFDDSLITLRNTDTFVKDNKVCYTIPVKSDKFFKVDSSSVSYKELPEYRCKGIKNNMSSTKEYNTTISLSGLSSDEITALDNIKPRDLFFNRLVCSNGRNLYYEFLTYDYGSGLKTGTSKGQVWVNDKPTAFLMEPIAGRTNCYGVQIDIKSLKWGKNTLKYRFVDNSDNITEGTLEFNPSFSSITGIIHDCLVDPPSLNGTTLTASMGIINPVTGYTYGERINNRDGMSELKVFGYKSSSGWDSTPLAIFDKDHLVPITDTELSTYGISVNVSGYTFVNVIYTGQYEYYNHIYYNGSFASTGTYNYVVPNGTKKDSVVICSNNNNVLVRVYSISDSGIYKDACQTWNEEKWEMLGTRESEEILTFSAGTLKAPVVFTNSWLQGTTNSGKYYCVVAHFANGDCVASPVMHH